MSSTFPNTIPGTGSDGQPQTRDQVIDDQFKILVSHYYLSPSNPLTACLPSMLDLENNCTATLGLYQSSDSVSIDGPTDSLDDIAKFFRTALPMQLQNASALEICDYWSVIQMTDFQYAAQSAWYDCSSAAPVAFNITASNFTVFNFTQDCQATVSYWDQYLDPSSFWYGYSWSNDLANLLQASLPSQYTNISYWALYDFASNVVNNGNLSALITEAANICQPEYCRMLGFTGNADIAGIGAIVTYGVIALLSTIICITTIFTKYGDDPELRKSRFKFALSKASVSFFDTLLYFNFMVMIAGIVYVTQAGTIYERVLCVLVSCLTNSASLVLVTVYSYPQEGKSLRQWTQAIGLSLSEPLLIIALLGFEDLDLFPLEDNYCYEGNILPLTAMKVSCWMQVASFILLILGLGLLNVAPYWVKLWSRIRQQPTSGDLAGLESLISLLLGVLVIVLQLVSMWINFYFIAVIREEAKTFFGSSYADNAMGYGQIIASGFCLQAIVQWLYLMWTFKQEVSESPNNDNISLRLLNLSTTQLSTTPPAIGTADPSDLNIRPPSPLGITDAHDSPHLNTPRTPTIELEEGRRSVPTTPTPSNHSTRSLAAAISDLGHTSSRDVVTGAVSRRPTFPSP